MLPRPAGVEGVKDFIIDCVKRAGPDACPPLILGVGVGGTFEKAAILSKKALFREVGSANPDPTLDALEKELLARVERGIRVGGADLRSEEHTSELQSLRHLVCRLLLEKKKNTRTSIERVRM